MLSTAILPLIITTDINAVVIACRPGAIKWYPILLASLNSSIPENVDVYLTINLEKQLQCKELLFIL